jgi:hypothetical protein
VRPKVEAIRHPCRDELAYFAAHQVDTSFLENLVNAAEDQEEFHQRRCTRSVDDDEKIFSGFDLEVVE